MTGQLFESVGREFESLRAHHFFCESTLKVFLFGSAARGEMRPDSRFTPLLGRWVDLVVKPAWKPRIGPMPGRSAVNARAHSGGKKVALGKISCPTSYFLAWISSSRFAKYSLYSFMSSGSCGLP